MARRDFDTASSVMFLLRLGELLEEWTHKKSVENLARSMSLNIDRVWMKTEKGEELLPLHQVQAGDQVVVRMGGMIPVDGVVQSGEVMVNQASLTGESVPVPKSPGKTVYAGTVVEEGECLIEITQQKGGTEEVYAYNIPVPRKMDNVIINLPGFLAGLPEEAYLSEFIPSPDEVAADETDVPSDDDFGMEDMGMGDESAAQ